MIRKSQTLIGFEIVSDAVSVVGLVAVGQNDFSTMVEDLSKSERLVVVALFKHVFDSGFQSLF